MVENSEKKSDKGLVAMIVVLAVMVVGLVVGVVMVNLKKSDQSEEVVKTEGEILYEISSNIYNMPADEVVEYLDEQLVKYKGTDLEYQIIIFKVNAYRVSGMIDEAIVFAESIDIEGMDDSEKISFYYNLSELYDEDGDEEKAEYYMDESNEIREKSGFKGLGFNGDA